MSRDLSYERYLASLPDTKPLSASEEIELTTRVREGDDHALEKLVKANLRFVISVAKQYENQGLPLIDLISEGNQGLIKAAHRFDETRGFKFISYAVWWIRQSILQALTEHARTVRVPVNRIKALKKVTRRAGELRQSLGREPSVLELADELHLQAADVSGVLLHNAGTVMLEQPVGKDNATAMEFIENPSAPRPDGDLDEFSLKQDLAWAISALKPREQKVIRLFFGLGKEKGKTLGEIGEILELTRERVRQIKEEALRKLRHPIRRRALLTYLD